jgi:hypothetical protein
MHPTVSHRAHLRAALLCGAFAFTGFAACADSLHFDPAGAGGSAVASTGGAPSGCRSNADCAYPRQLCDTESRACVACFVVSDCASLPGTVCSKGACECPPGGACGAGAGGSTGVGGAGGGGSGGGAGDAGPDGSADCASCDQALLMGGKLCPGTPADDDYTALQNCAGCKGALGACSGPCNATFCDGLPATPLCRACLEGPDGCMARLAACMSD